MVLVGIGLQLPVYPTILRDFIGDGLFADVITYSQIFFINHAGTSRKSFLQTNRSVKKSEAAYVNGNT